jgi:hypothetical protein
MAEIILTADPRDLEALDAMRFDPSVGQWLMQAGLPTQLARPFVTEVGDTIAEIPPDHFLLMAARISQYKKRPWTAADIEELKKIGLDQMKQRRIRRLAAESLQVEAEPWRRVPGMAEHVRRWDEAIAVLRMPRGMMDSPHNWLHFSQHGEDMRPWVYMATEIAAFLVQILRGFKQGVPSLGEKSPVVVFVHKALLFIGVNNPPAPKTLGNKLRETLAPLLKDWPAR